MAAGLKIKQKIISYTYKFVIPVSVERLPSSDMDLSPLTKEQSKLDQTIEMGDANITLHIKAKTAFEARKKFNKVINKAISKLKLKDIDLTK